MVLFWSQIIFRVILARIAYWIVIAGSRKELSVAHAYCKIAQSDDNLGERTFDQCVGDMTLAFFIDNLSYYWFDIYIATILYKWACLADEGEKTETEQSKVKPEEMEMTGT